TMQILEFIRPALLDLLLLNALPGHAAFRAPMAVHAPVLAARAGWSIPPQAELAVGVLLYHKKGKSPAGAGEF
ncbi:MAG: hypothetical protein GX425_03575, partial [Peptococcaceae bacterium]|nr:hypothetical protein [Peptococcaceae bacterium]